MPDRCLLIRRDGSIAMQFVPDASPTAVRSRTGKLAWVSEDGGLSFITLQDMREWAKRNAMKVERKISFVSPQANVNR